MSDVCETVIEWLLRGVLVALLVLMSNVAYQFVLRGDWVGAALGGGGVALCAAALIFMFLARRL